MRMRPVPIYFLHSGFYTLRKIYSDLMFLFQSKKLGTLDTVRVIELQFIIGEGILL